MEFTYSKNDLKSLISNYYLEKEGRRVEVDIEVKKELVGYYANLSVITTISIREEVTVLGKKTKAREEISKDKVSSILAELLEETGYSLDNVIFDEGINTEWRGYGMNEYQENLPYFNGVKLSVSKNSLVKKK